MYKTLRWETTTWKRIRAHLSEFVRQSGFLESCAAALALEINAGDFYQAWKSLHRYNGSCEVFTWLAAIAKNTYFKYLRKHKKETLCFDGFENLYAESEFSPDIQAEKSELCEAVTRAITALDGKYRDVVVLRIYAELPFSAIGELLSITENSAKVIFHRAKHQIGKALEADGFVPGIGT